MAVVTLQMIFDRAWKNHVQDKTPRNDSPEFGWRSCGDALPAFHPARAEKGLGAIDIQAKYADVIYENAQYAQNLSDSIDSAIAAVYNADSKLPFNGRIQFALTSIALDWGFVIPGTERHMQQDRLVAHSIELVVNMQKMYQASPPEIFDALATVLTCMLSGEQSPDRNLQEQCGALMHALDSMRHRFKQAYVTE